MSFILFYMILVELRLKQKFIKTNIWLILLQVQIKYQLLREFKTILLEEGSFKMHIFKDKSLISEFIIDCLVQMKWMKSTNNKDNVVVIFINIPINFLQLN